jgi:hypothetical protein
LFRNIISTFDNMKIPRIGCKDQLSQVTNTQLKADIKHFWKLFKTVKHLRC